MSIASDFTIDFDKKIVSHTSGTTVYSVNAVYSYIQDFFDETISMTQTVPMSAQTPTEYALINSWFMPEDTMKYLYGGAIQTIGWNTSSFSEGIFVVRLTAYTNATPTDIGKIVTDGTNTGYLVDYNNTLQKWWVRKITGTITGALTITGGIGGGTTSSVISGEALFANIYTLGALDTTSANILYVEQINSDLTNNEIPNYWGPEHIDLLIKVKEAGVLIDSGIVKVYCREFKDLYSHFSINVSTGGRNPVPLSTSADSNNTTSIGTVMTWGDVTITFGTFSRDILDGSGPHDYDVEIDCGLRTTITEVYERLKLITSRASGGQFYRSADPSYAEVTQAPYGSLAGGIFFGARGVWLKDVPANDSGNIQLMASDGIVRTPPFVAAGNLIIGDILSDDPSAEVFMYFTTNPSGNFGTSDAILVQDMDGDPITGSIASLSLFGWTFAYDTNTQGGRTPGTDAAVTIVAVGRNHAQYILVSKTLSRSINQDILLLSELELNYNTGATYP